MLRAGARLLGTVERNVDNRDTGGTTARHYESPTDRGGDGKFVTATITGARFSRKNAIVKLVQPGVAEFEPADWKVINNAEIIATWDLTGAPHGLYDLVVTNPDGSQAMHPMSPGGARD